MPFDFADIEMESTPGPATAKAIARAEQECGAKFPSALKQFLLIHNGGKPKNCVFPTTGFSRLEIKSFFSAGGPRGRCLVRRNKQNQLPIPPGHLAIGEDMSGHLILMTTAGRGVGEISVWNYTEASSKITRIGDSLEQVLQLCQPEPDVPNQGCAAVVIEFDDHSGVQCPAESPFICPNRGVLNAWELRKGDVVEVDSRKGDRRFPDYVLKTVRSIRGI